MTHWIILTALAACSTPKGLEAFDSGEDPSPNEDAAESDDSAGGDETGGEESGGEESGGEEGVFRSGRPEPHARGLDHASRADLEVCVVDGQRASAASLLGKRAVDVVLLVRPVHTSADKCPGVRLDHRSAPPAPAAWIESSLQCSSAVLKTELVRAFLVHDDPGRCRLWEQVGF